MHYFSWPRILSNHTYSPISGVENKIPYSPPPDFAANEVTKR